MTPSESLQGKLIELIAFRIGDQEFCIEVKSIREIRSWTPVTKIPHAPDFVLGVVNLRGVVLPIIDLAARLGFAPADPSARHAIMVAETEGRLVGLLVDGVSDIISVKGDDLQPTPDVASEVAQAYISGILSFDKRLISRIELQAVLPPLTACAA